ncbi:DUF6638 family protein [Defluviimonas salinarum]|uniref:Uncharacterized protein n=1 Tax=Defluviimonas salinarum TaxID=2992147 RepID=A0ABT3J5J1_9RHOB|nr:DUF6638 family protein [Defluviimonas salinarum]MCW3782956.1 hypothetical protein [Defluviimonas salinarum]
MKRLIEKGLMFGNLFAVDSPTLVARYNRALKELTGRETALEDFHVDISGYSPEIGHEFGDELYLNHLGCNRQFILLSTAQKTAPLLNAEFSVSREILRRFIEANEAQLASLTARDAVAGELENSVYRLDMPDRLLDLRRIEIVADTTSNHVAEAAELSRLIGRFETEPGSWRDDVLIAEMVRIARKTGDITRHPVAFTATNFPTPDFWTSHFGGAYVFASASVPTVIASRPGALAGLAAAAVTDLTRRNEVAGFLTANSLVENLFSVRRDKAIRILRQKMDFILIGAAAEAGVFAGGISRREIGALPRLLGSAIPDAWHGLAEVMAWAEADGRWPAIDSTHPAWFYLMRAAPGPNRDLVNMLLSELCPRDVQKMFIFHKAMFYRTYAGWSEEKKEFVSAFLERSYQMNKAGVRADLFGDGAEPSTTPGLETMS